MKGTFRELLIFQPIRIYKGVKGCILCFSIANRNSFESLPKWIRIIRLCTENIPIILVGTKSDLNNVVSDKEINEFVRNLNLSGAYLTSINLPCKKDV